MLYDRFKNLPKWLHIVACLATTCFAISTDQSNPDLITYLPGVQNHSLYQNQYSGYLRASPNDYFHYWFVEAAQDPASAPLLLWLNGGPGCSSLDGYLTELGPLHPTPDGNTLLPNPNSWTTFANVLFIESPACVGFSYNTNNDCNASDNSTAENNFQALLSFFDKFPQLKKNDFYVTGESYGGVYVPTLTEKIVVNKNSGINLKGFAVGNGLSSWRKNDDSLIFFANYHGLLGERTWQTLVNYCCKNSIESRHNCNFYDSTNQACNYAVNNAFNIVYNDGLNMYNLYAKCMTSGHPAATNNTLSRYHVDRANLFKKLRTTLDKTISLNENLDVPCINSYPMSNYLNKPEVRKALHIPQKVQEWAICSTVVNENYDLQYMDMSNVYKNLKAAGIRGLVYNGDVDMACNFLGDEWFVEDLQYKVVEDRRMWHSEKQVAGFVKRFEMLDLLTVKGSGHMVPQDKPVQALHMIKAFVLGNPY